MRRLSIAITVGVIVSLSLAAVLILGHEVMTKAVGVEAYKLLLQFLLVVVLGGGVTLIYQAFNRHADQRLERLQHEKERAEALRETRQRYLHDLIGHYNAVKRARRLLRAKALTSEPALLDRRVRVGEYDELLMTVLDAQLAIETMARAMRAEGSLFAGEQDLTASLSTAEAYLRALITEYEEVLPQAGQEIALRTMPELAAFIGPYKESGKFRVEFVHTVQAAMATFEWLIVE
jgi:hypothetical protein